MLTKLIVGPDAENWFETYFTDWLTYVHVVQPTAANEQGEIDPVVRDRNVHEQFFIRHLFLKLYCRRHDKVPKQFPNSNRPVHILLEDPCSSAASAWCDGTHKHQHVVGIEKSVAEDSMLHAPGMYLTTMKEMSQQLPSYLCVNAATERTHVEWEAEDDVKGGLWTPTRSKLPARRRFSICVTDTCTSMQLGRSTGANGTQQSWPQMDRYQQEHH